MSTPPARYMTIEGRKTLVVENTPPLPKSLDALIRSMFGVTVSNDIRPTGASVACDQWRTHRFDVLREGRALGLDRVLRDIRVEMCQDCGAVCVRDISYDRRSGLPVGGAGPRRRNLILGWYSGAARANRVHL